MRRRLGLSTASSAHVIRRFELELNATTRWPADLAVRALGQCTQRTSRRLQISRQIDIDRYISAAASLGSIPSTNQPLSTFIIHFNVSCTISLLCTSERCAAAINLQHAYVLAGSRSRLRKIGVYASAPSNTARVLGVLPLVCRSQRLHTTERCQL